MASHIGRVHLRVGCVGVLCLLASLGGGPTTADSSRPVFSGQATAVQANVLNLQPITLADTGYFEAPEFLPPAPCTEEGISMMCFVSPCDRNATVSRSPCAVRVGRPVDGPTRCTSKITAGVSA